MSKLAGWIAHYNGKKVEIKIGEDADSLYDAKLFAIDYFKVPKSKRGLVAVSPGYEE